MSNYRILLVWLGCLALTVSCSSGGKSGPVETPLPPQTEVTLQFYSDTGLRETYTRGLQVLVYADNNQTISRTIDVGPSGEASLGQFTEQLSLSLIYSNDSIENGPPENGAYQVVERRHIRSVLNYPLNELAIIDGEYYLRLSTQSSLIPVPQEAPTARNITVTVQTDGLESFEAADQELLHVNVQPSLTRAAAGFAVFGIVDDQFSDQDLCATNIDNDQSLFLDGEIQRSSVQDNGAVSFLSTLSVGPFNPYQRYGFVLDQQVANNMDYTLSADLVASTVNVNHSNYTVNLPDNSSITSAFSRNRLVGVRNGVSYNVSSYLQNTFDSNANPVVSENTPVCTGTNSGGLNLRVADQFPVDHYVHLHSSSASNFPQGLQFINGMPPEFVTASNNFCAQASASSTIPTTIELAPNPLDIAGFDFDPDRRLLEWQVPEEGLVSHTRITLYPEQEDPIFGLWTIDISANANSEVMLPAISAAFTDEIADSLSSVPERIDTQVFDYIPGLTGSSRINANSVSLGETKNQCTRSVRRLQVNIQDQ